MASLRSRSPAVVGSSAVLSNVYTYINFRIAWNQDRLPDIQTALFEIKTVLLQIETALPDIEKTIINKMKV